MNENTSDERLFAGLEALASSLFEDPEWSAFRERCFRLDVECWHDLNLVLDHSLSGIWEELELPSPSLGLHLSTTPDQRWRLCNIYCSELDAIIATALLGQAQEKEHAIH